MKSKLIALLAIVMIIFPVSCSRKVNDSELNVIFLAHSTGIEIWNGNKASKLSNYVSRRSIDLGLKLRPRAILPTLFKEYNKEHNVYYQIDLLVFPKAEPYGWNNYPYDYYNIWVKNGENVAYMEEPTLEPLTERYEVIVFKHCFPVCQIQADQDSADINSAIKTISNYKLQYNALKNKLHSYPNTKFILFTGATHVQSQLTEEEAIRAREFFNWVINDWDIPEDNIFIWDLYVLQTEGGLYLKEENAVSDIDPHPNPEFARRAAHLLFNRIVDIIENEGTQTTLTGEMLSH